MTQYRVFVYPDPTALQAGLIGLQSARHDFVSLVHEVGVGYVIVVMIYV